MDMIPLGYRCMHLALYQNEYSRTFIIEYSHARNTGGETGNRVTQHFVSNNHIWLDRNSKTISLILDPGFCFPFRIWWGNSWIQRCSLPFSSSWRIIITVFDFIIYFISLRLKRSLAHKLLSAQIWSLWHCTYKWCTGVLKCTQSLCEPIWVYYMVCLINPVCMISLCAYFILHQVTFKFHW